VIHDRAVRVLQVVEREVHQGEVVKEVALQRRNEFIRTSVLRADLVMHFRIVDQGVNPPGSVRGLLGRRLAVFRGGEVPRQKAGPEANIAKFPLELFVRPGVLIYCNRERALLGAGSSNRGANPFNASCDENHLVSESQVHGYPRRLKNPPSMG